MKDSVGQSNGGGESLGRFGSLACRTKIEPNERL